MEGRSDLHGLPPGDQEPDGARSEQQGEQVLLHLAALDGLVVVQDEQHLLVGQGCDQGVRPRVRSRAAQRVADGLREGVLGLGLVVETDEVNAVGKSSDGLNGAIDR